MRFKAVLSERGLRALERSFLPTLEKFGKKAALLLGPDDVHLIQSGTDADGLQVVARLALSVLFEEGSYVCTSRQDNLIGLGFEVPLMLKVLRSAAANAAHGLEVKLSMRPGGGGRPGAPPPPARPVLAFSWRGDDVTITQDMPVSTPYAPPAVAGLRRAAGVDVLCDFYVDLGAEAGRLAATADRLKALSPDVCVAATRQGDLHLAVSAPGVEYGAELRELPVLPAAAAAGAAPLAAPTPGGRLREARRAGAAAEATLLVRHLARALHSSHLTQPAQLLAGVAPNGGFFHVMFVYRRPDGDGGAYDDDISLSYKLPVREEGT